MDISVVSPVYNSEDSLNQLYQRLTKTLHALGTEYEIVLVNDGSQDRSWKLILDIAKKDHRVKGVNLSKNFGQHNAISAGLEFAVGEWVVVMDCDLQDLPEEIPKLFREAKNKYDVVLARRTYRNDTLIKRLFSYLFYLIFDYFTDRATDSSIANFGIYNQLVIKNYRQLKEHSIFFPTSISWLGFSRGYVDVTHGKRLHGKSTYNFCKLFRLGSNVIISFSNKPLLLFVHIGFGLSVFSFLYVIYIVVKYFVWKIPILGWASVISSIFFLGGMILAGIGILGLYIDKIYDEVKNRPKYIVKEAVNTN